MTCKWVNRAPWVKNIRPCGNRVRRGSRNELCFFHVQSVIGFTWMVWE